MVAKRITRTLLNSAFALMVAGSASVAQAALIGPTPYLSSANSPFFPFTGFSYFYLENFEDGLFNVPGVTASTGQVTSTVPGAGPFIDSVDADDGSIDGSGSRGNSFFVSNGNNGVIFTFSPSLPGGLPNSVGIVLTDGDNNFNTPIRFEAFDASNVSLGVLVANHLDNNFSGGTAEDRFYGATNPGRISRITISNPGSGNGLEVDHLQYGLRVNNIPEPSSLALIGIALVGFVAIRRRKA